MFSINKYKVGALVLVLALCGNTVFASKNLQDSNSTPGGLSSEPAPMGHQGPDS